MDPLVVLGDVGEAVHPVLFHGEPLGRPEFDADGRLEIRYSTVDLHSCYLLSLVVSAAVLTSAEQHGAGDRATAHGNDRHLGVTTDLAFAPLTPQLHAGFVQETHAVQTAAGQLPTTGVEGQFSAQR